MPDSSSKPSSSPAHPFPSDCRTTEAKAFDTEEYWQNRLTRTYDLDGVGFTGMSRSYNRWLYRVRRSNFLRIVGRYNLGASPRVLDVGSGTGFYVDLWREVGVANLLGIDITEVAVQRLQSKYPNFTFVQQDIGDPLLQDDTATFEAISAMDVLFHIVDDVKYDRALSNIYRLLKPGGYLFFTGNFLHSDTVRSQHIVHRSMDATRRFLREVGFVVKERQPVFMIMNEPVDSPSSFIRRLWRLVHRVAAYSEASGYVLGLLLFPLELLMTRLASESPTTEILVCRKPST